MGRSEVSTSLVKWSEGLSNRVPIIVRIYIDQMWFAVYMAVWFITYIYFYIPLGLICIIVYMVVCFVSFCLIL